MFLSIVFNGTHDKAQEIAKVLGHYDCSINVLTGKLLHITDFSRADLPEIQSKLQSIDGLKIQLNIPK